MPQAVAAAGISAGAGLLGSFLNRPSSSDKALQSAQTQNLTSQTSLADFLAKQGKDQLALTGPAYKKAQDYYTGILSGNAAANLQQMNPERQQISQLYGGATARANRTLTGPARDQALADITRESAGKLADLIPNARKDAASTLYAGADPTRAMGMLSGASGAYSGANAGASNLFNNNMDRAKMSADNGASFAKLLGSINWASLFGGKGGSAAAGGTNPLNSIFQSNLSPINFGKR